jgi:hypothetical protein
MKVKLPIDKKTGNISKGGNYNHSLGVAYNTTHISSTTAEGSDDNHADTEDPSDEDTGNLANAHEIKHFSKRGDCLDDFIPVILLFIFEKFLDD